MPSTTATVIRDRHYFTRELLLGVRLGTVSGFKTLKKLRASSLSKQVSLFAKVTSKIALLLTILALAGLVVSAIFFLPQIYYRVFPAQVVISESTIPGTILGGDFTKPSKITEGRQYVPPLDESLPEGDWVTIPQIGVRTQLKETEDPNDALVDGAWLSPTYGKPGDTGVPIIIAAHRFGWQWWWQSDYGKYHSFYYLPDTEPGTQVEIISGKRKWVYEIYAGEENDEISDYSADLILYTCKHISSPVRFIRYARLVNPTLDTQPG